MPRRPRDRGDHRTLSRGRPLLATGEVPPSPPQQERSVERRRRLRVAARVVFADRGFEGASVEEIASRAGMAVGAFYLHFASKRQLLVDLMNELLTGIEALDLTLPDAGTTRDSLRRFLLTALRTDRANLGVIKAWQEAVVGDAALAKMNRAVVHWTNTRVLELLQGIHRSSGSRRSARLEHLARVVDRYLWMLLGRAADTSAQGFEDEVAVVSDMIFHYLVRDRHVRRPLPNQ